VASPAAGRARARARRSLQLDSPPRFENNIPFRPAPSFRSHTTIPSRRAKSLGLALPPASERSASRALFFREPGFKRSVSTIERILQLLRHLPLPANDARHPSDAPPHRATMTGALHKLLVQRCAARRSWGPVQAADTSRPEPMRPCSSPPPCAHPPPSPAALPQARRDGDDALRGRDARLLLLHTRARPLRVARRRDTICWARGGRRGRGAAPARDLPDAAQVRRAAAAPPRLPEARRATGAPPPILT
jgi:hypothetical protein